jgi:PAB1-binding protein PBP1
VSNKLLIGFAVATLAAASAGCSTTDNANANANANANSAVASNTTQPGPDNSEITTSVDANGVKTETRVFHNNPRVAKVVVTTRDSKRITTVYAPSGQSKDLKEEAGDALSATGNAIADAAGFLAE